jgi:hypothetical protein
LLQTEGKFSKKALDMLTATEGGIIEEAPEDPANESVSGATNTSCNVIVWTF